MCLMHTKKVKIKNGTGYKLFLSQDGDRVKSEFVDDGNEPRYQIGRWYKARRFPRKRAEIIYEPGFHIYINKPIATPGFVVAEVEYENAYIEGTCPMRDSRCVVAKRMKILSTSVRDNHLEEINF